MLASPVWASGNIERLKFKDTNTINGALMSELSKVVQVSLLGNDLGLTDAIARTLGPGFTARSTSDLDPQSMAGVAGIL